MENLLQQLDENLKELYRKALDADALLEQLQQQGQAKYQTVFSKDAGFIDEALVADAKARQLQLYVYTVDEADDLARLKALGVDGVFTNYPARSRKLLT